MKVTKPKNSITMAENKKTPFELLREKQGKLFGLKDDWEKITPPTPIAEDRNKDREAALKRINELLGVIKSEINVYWGPGIDPDHEVRILIADKQTNPHNKQVEDIEGDVHRMEGI